ncbi:MAG: hypothetical protein IKN55_08645, partial [Oscillospiraceae bacterium]|nr:hypothetical protein [Oscillospiraceae bacterium]
PSGLPQTFFGEKKFDQKNRPGLRPMGENCSLGKFFEKNQRFAFRCAKNALFPAMGERGRRLEQEG